MQALQSQDVCLCTTEIIRVGSDVGIMDEFINLQVYKHMYSGHR